MFSRLPSAVWDQNVIYNRQFGNNSRERSDSKRHCIIIIANDWPVTTIQLFWNYSILQWVIFWDLKHFNHHQFNCSESNALPSWQAPLMAVNDSGLVLRKQFIHFPLTTLQQILQDVWTWTNNWFCCNYILFAHKPTMTRSRQPYSWRNFTGLVNMPPLFSNSLQLFWYDVDSGAYKAAMFKRILLY